MRPTVHSLSHSLTRTAVSATRCRCRKLGVLAQQVEPQARSRSESLPTHHEPPIPRLWPDPYHLVASELTHIRKNMLNLLGAAHPGLADMAEYYFFHPSKQLRSLVVLLFSRATNGVGRHWERKHWDAAYQSRSGQFQDLDQPLTLPNVLHEWNPSMRDDTASFESVFTLQRPVPPPPSPPFPRRIQNYAPCIVSPAALLPSQIRLAQITEMIHIASLLHDAITKDPGDEKNGFGNKLSILGGDFLLGRASTALSQLGESEVVELVASVISNVVEGEFLRMEEINTPELGVIEGPTSLKAAWELYLRKTYLKSASLMAKGARSAVILGGCQEGDALKEVAYLYGRNLGIAYQLVEDIKNVGHLEPGLSTGPILFASEESPILLSLIQRNLKMPGDTELAVEYIQGTSGIERTRILAEEYAFKAREVLCVLPDSDTKLALEALTDIAIERTR